MIILACTLILTASRNFQFLKLWWWHHTRHQSACHANKHWHDASNNVHEFPSNCLYWITVMWCDGTLLTDSIVYVPSCPIKLFKLRAHEQLGESSHLIALRRRRRRRRRFASSWRNLGTVSELNWFHHRLHIGDSIHTSWGICLPTRPSQIGLRLVHTHMSLGNQLWALPLKIFCKDLTQTAWLELWFSS